MMNHVLRSRRLPTDPSILMSWVNALIGTNFHSLKDLRSGIIWCRLLEALYPGSVNLDTLQMDKTDWPWNYRVLKRTLGDLGFYPHINVQELVTGRVGDTIYMLHFFIDLFTVHLGRIIKRGKQSSTKEVRDPKGVTKIESVLQWLKSFFTREKAEPKEKSEEELNLEFHRQALLLLFLPIPEGCAPVSTEEMVKRLGGGSLWPEQDHQSHEKVEQLKAYRRQKTEDHRLLRSLVETCLQFRRGRQQMEQEWLASLKKRPAT
ncbi:uncharacterized protein LOC108097051 isoform X2 [Drosophila ficusphila]|uniref:uncharacterized protein LOC108097051 isoform X2 n=1 Tax=Drosophila ficusphila TaxID=30025 RepID=UPI0007E70939|nr:uncharacterized protein LOC108097051 isoform X2 [Drosophila ficusphila]